MRYPVTLTPDDGTFLVTFPDVPEAITYGETVEEALRRAPDALLTIFDAFMKDRRDIPAPSERGKRFVTLPALETRQDSSVPDDAERSCQQGRARETAQLASPSGRSSPGRAT
jgi:predicted RNase H-like HicB family nuclease